MKLRKFLFIALLAAAITIISAYFNFPHLNIFAFLKETSLSNATAVLQTSAPTSAVETTDAPEPEPTTEETQPTTEAPEPTEITEPPFPADMLSSKWGFVYDATAEEYRYTFGDQNRQIKIASITKIFSAWVALQILPADTVITAGEELTWLDEESSRAWIYEGQKLRVETLVQGMIIPSGNDASYVLAVAAGRELLGDPNADARAACDAFIAIMNMQAVANGLSDTHFANPDGIDEPDHYSSPADVLKMAQLAMSNDIIRNAAAIKTMTAYYTSGQTANWTNSNPLLHADGEYYCPNTTGLKTGHTEGAGWCLVSTFEKDGTTLIIGVFGSDTMEARNDDTLKLYEAFR